MGFWEIVVILLLALLLFGPKRLPEIGRTLGRTLSELRRATHELRQTLDTEIDLEGRSQPARPDSPAAPEVAEPRDRPEPPEPAPPPAGEPRP